MKLSTIKQFTEKHPAFPEGGMRHRIFHEHKNGLAESCAILRDGRRVFIDEDKFFDWLKSKNQVA